MSRTLALLTIGLIGVTGAGAQEGRDPLESQLEEQVRVRLVIVDAMVVDRAGTTVPDLAIDDFELFVDSTRTAIDTLDVNCPAGAAEDPRSVGRTERRGPPAAPDAPRKLVLLLDYLHLTQTDRVDALYRVRRMVREGRASNEQIMVVALNGGIRIEQGFTTDREAVLETLDRMEYDISLWLPDFRHLNERGFAGGMTALFDLLEPVPGPKAVLFFSRFLGPSGGSPPGSRLREMDDLFETAAAAATRARTALYPVHAKGLTAYDISGGGGSSRPEEAPRLARFAVETGGRFTEDTNDLSLAYARAQRDLACRYAVGFYDRSGLTEVVHRVTLNVKRPGLRVVHPKSFEHRRDSVRGESELRSAHVAPEMYQNGVVRCHLFPVRPAGKKRWEAQLAVRFPVAIPPGEEGIRDFGAVIRTGSKVVHRFDRRVTLSGGEPGEARQFTFIEPLTLKPGNYEVSVVVSDPATSRPMTAVASVDLPELPRGETFLVGPVLGRRAGETVMVSGTLAGERPKGAEAAEHDRIGSAATFEPLLVQRLDEPGALLAVTRVCRIGGSVGGAAGTVVRRLVRRSGETVGSLPGVDLELEGEEEVRCQSLVDLLSLTAAGPGEYTFTAAVETESPAAQPVESLLNFAVGSGDGERKAQ